MRLILCCHKIAGLEVLVYIMKNNLCDELYVFTHEGMVSDYCKENNIRHSTDKIDISNLPFVPDLISSVYYNYIISKEVIDSCRGKIFNAHPSALPKHKGCSSVPWAIIEGDQMTAITFHYISEKIDSGNIILQSVIHIAKDETQLSLYEKCMQKAIDFWPAAFFLVKIGFKGLEQEDEPASYHKRGCPYNGEIDGSWSEQKTERFIRAMYFPPLPAAKYKGEYLLPKIKEDI